jgi:6-pyruvoyltetrahydropterin/6-carboxytetrahydropterin synthase
MSLSGADAVKSVRSGRPAAMRPIIEKLDHSYLNDVPGLENPTIEMMADWLWKKLSPQLPGLAEIVIHETPFARCSYRGE